MDLDKINVKFFLADPEGVAPGVSLDAFIGVFNAWIQASDGEYYDLADYGHVPAGPGIVLVADEANVSIDNGGNRPGLLYNRKRPLAGSNAEKLKTAVSAALGYCRKLEDEPALGGRLRFRGDEAVVIVNDRLAAPNTEETFSALKPEVEALARTLFGGAQFSLEREPDPKKRFGVRIKSAAWLDTRALVKNIAGSAN